MADPYRQFLSPKEALLAVRLDFEQYPLQTRLFLDLCPSLLPSRSVVEDASRGCLWIAEKAGGRRRFRKIEAGRLRTLLLEALVSDPPEGSDLAALCERVFEVPAHSGKQVPEGVEGIWLETEMESFRCRQCGECCIRLDYHFELTAADYRLWQQTGRKDILEWVAVFTRPGRADTYAIWVIPGTRKFAGICPWLETLPDGKTRRCRIHEVKPEVCRHYPASRKHARITGCPAFKDLKDRIKVFPGPGPNPGP